jgi:hypothetical protein
MGKNIEHIRSLNSCPGDYCIAPNSNSGSGTNPMSHAGTAREKPATGPNSAGGTAPKVTKALRTGKGK